MRAGAPAQEATMNSQKLTHEVDFICPHCEAQYGASYTEYPHLAGPFRPRVNPFHSKNIIRNNQHCSLPIINDLLIIGSPVRQ
jgi:hypothetical protein